MKLSLAQTLSLSFQVDVMGESIFENDDGPEGGDGGTTARAADPTPS